MANSIDNIKYTLLNGIVVGDTIDLLQFIIQGGQTIDCVRNVTYDDGVLKFYKTGATTPSVTTDQFALANGTVLYSDLVFDEGDHTIYGSNETAGSLTIWGGNTTGCPKIQLYGPDSSSDYAGYFDISARNSSSRGSLTGTPAGLLTWNGDNIKVGKSSSTTIIQRPDTTGTLRITGGTSIYDARLNLVGGDSSASAGYFDLRAGKDSTNYMSLAGRPDSTLLWTGKVSGTSKQWSLLTPVQLTVTYQNGGSGVLAYMIGKMVIVQFNGAKMTTVSTTSSSQVICTLSAPSGYTLNNANNAYTSYLSQNWSSAPSVQTLAQVISSLEIKIYNYQTANNTLYGQLVFFTA